MVPMMTARSGEREEENVGVSRKVDLTAKSDEENAGKMVPMMTARSGEREEENAGKTISMMTARSGEEGGRAILRMM